MPQYTFTITGTITGTGPDQGTAKRNLTACLDNTLQHLDDTCIGADITTSPVTLHGTALATLARLIQAEADTALRGSTLSRTISLHRIAAWAQQLQDAFTSSDTPTFWCARHRWDGDDPNEYCPDCVAASAISDSGATEPARAVHQYVDSDGESD